MNRSACLSELTRVPMVVTIFVGTMTGVAAQTDPPAGSPPLQPRQTPAQQKYGLPQNPVVGDVVDVDLTQPLTLDRAIRIGLQRQNSIAISKTQTDAASQRLVQSRSAYFPTIAPSYRYNYNLQPGGAFFIGGQLLTGSRVSENVNSNLVASMQLFDSGQREARIGLSRRSLFANEYGLGNERQNVILSVTEGYYNLLRTKELLRVQEQTVARARTNLESIQAQVAVGNAAQSDTLQAEADLANAEVNLLTAQADYEVAQASLKNAMGVVTYEPVKTADETLPAPPAIPDESSLEEYVDLAYENRLDLKQQQEQINAQGYNVRLAHLNAGLSVSANVQQGFQADPNTGETRILNFAVSYPLFDGGNVRAAIRESKATLEQSKRSLDQVEQTIRFGVEQAFRIREQSRLRYTASLKAMQAAELNYNAALERQRNGLVNVLDVLTAQLQYVNAQVSNVQSIYDYYIADARLRRSVGLNDTEYLPRVPGIKPPRVTFLKRKSPVNFFSSLAQSAPKSALSPDLSSGKWNQGTFGGTTSLPMHTSGERNP